MGLRFRRSIGFGPFRYTVSASSRGITQGVSAGVRGARVSVNSRGQRRTTLSVPGTGVSYVDQGRVRAPKLRWVVVILVVLFLLGLLAAIGQT